MKMIAVYLYGGNDPIAIFQDETEANKWLYKYVDENVATGFGISVNVRAIEVELKEAQ